jgi:hypothetical protein
VSTVDSRDPPQILDFDVSRRQAILGAGAVAATSLLASPAIVRAFETSRDAPFRAIYDERFPEALNAARTAKNRGWPVRIIHGDPTDVWYNELSVRWKQGPASVVGLTGSDSLFVLERLAWDAGLRVVERQIGSATDLISWTIASPRLGAANSVA